MSGPSISGSLNLAARDIALEVADTNKPTIKAYSQFYTATVLRFETFEHPYVCDFIKALNRGGLEELFKVRYQKLREVGPDGSDFSAKYSPNVDVVAALPARRVTFDPRKPYSEYNWELFFHSALLIVEKLIEDHRFEDVEKWLPRIFDPTDPENDAQPQYWKFLPFRDEFSEYSKPNRKTMTDLFQILAMPGDDPDGIGTKRSLLAQIRQITEHPFEPHPIALLRITPYMWATAFKFLDKEIGHGDQFNRRGTLEAVPIAALHYTRAWNLVGPRPERVPARAEPKAETYATLRARLNGREQLSFLDPLVDAENLFPSASELPAPNSDAATALQGPLGLTRTLYFCIPQNEKLLSYYDTLENRFDNLRHCRDIEGVERQLPLFEPRIDPALLVRAVAAGLDISSVLNDVNAALPNYRFNVMIQKATELCSEVKALGQALLSTLEKRDAEELTLLRSQHEIKLLEAVRTVRENQIEEAKQTLEGLKRNRIVVEARQQYYLGRPYKIPEEQEHLDSLSDTKRLQATQASMEFAAAILHLLPDLKIGSLPTIGATYGSTQVSGAVQAFGSGLGATASALSTGGSISSTEGSYKRRLDDWMHQADLARKEVDQIDKQIAAAEIRVAIADRELQNHDQQIENSKVVEEYMRTKLTNVELHSWTISKLKQVYFQSYDKLAVAAAKRAERAYRFELGIEDSNFIKFGYWDSAREGLLAGEQLMQDIKRMEMDYLDKHGREKELTFAYSLALENPMALLKLKYTGECIFEVSEHFLIRQRPELCNWRIRALSVTMPCVTGPFTTVSAKLTLLKNSCRIKSIPAAPYERDFENDDPRFRDNLVPIQSICTSTGQNDFGLHEFRFEDSRYNPFECAGAISRWRLELVKDPDLQQFPPQTISDVVLQFRCTARDGGVRLGEAAGAWLKQQTSGESEELCPLMRLFGAKHEFPAEWHRFVNSDSEPRLEIKLQPMHFPYPFRTKALNIRRIAMFAKLKAGTAVLAIALKRSTGENGDSSAFEMTLNTNPVLGLLAASSDVEITILRGESREDSLVITPKNAESSKTIKKLEDLWLLLDYTVDFASNSGSNTI